MKIIEHTKNIITVEDFWSADRCSQFIQNSEKIGYEEALVQTEKGAQLIDGIRNNQRILYIDDSLAEEIWLDLQNIIPKKIGRSFVIGLNEMFRFYKYEVSQEFKKHRDQSYIRNEFEFSFYTLMIYLNEDFKGGETIFKDMTISPKQGSVLIFLHDLEHEGKKIEAGIKYVLRTDIMYRIKE